MTSVILAILLAAALCFAYRLARGPSLADRVIGVDGLLVTGVAAIVANAARTDNSSFIPIAVVTSLVAFIATSIVARFIERREQ